MSGFFCVASGGARGVGGLVFTAERRRWATAVMPHPLLDAAPPTV
jgi:hypothetical protein